MIVTANLPPFVQSGARIDVTVSSLGDATSLAGGTLVMTPLKAADGEIYAVAQGLGLRLRLHRAKGEAETADARRADRRPRAQRRHRRAPGRRRASRTIGTLTLQLRNPDFSTAVTIADAINAYARAALRQAASRSEQDSRTVIIAQAGGHFGRALHRRAREPGRRIRHAGPRRHRRAHRHHRHRQGRPHLHGRDQPRHADRAHHRDAEVVQPEPFSKGETAVEPYTDIEADQPDARVAVLDGPDLETLVAGLNRLGVKPDGIIAILQGIKSAGALQAELVLQ